jgi:hypothetical protein
VVQKKSKAKVASSQRKISSNKKASNIFDDEVNIDDFINKDYESIFFADEFKTPRSTEESDTNRLQKLKIKFVAIAYRSIFATIAVTALVSVALTLVIQSFFNLGFNNQGSANGTDQVVLTEPELRQIVSELGKTIYWAGPMANAKYTLSVTDTAAFVRYLPDGEGAEDAGMNYLVVATYEINAAYDAVLTAGNEQDGISISNSDGAAIYYNKTSPNNVYLAYPNTNYQIEIFDPSADRALQIATSSGLLQPIR